MRRTAPSRRLIIGASVGLCVTSSQACAQTRASVPFRLGVNLAGLEFNPSQIPGRLDTDYVAPDPRELAYYRAAGMNTIRVPFLWERLQPNLDAGFDDAYLALLQTSVREAFDMHVILDAHQYGRRIVDGVVHIIGETRSVTIEHFAQFWRALAQRFSDAPNVVFGLQNEPHDQRMDILVSTHNRAIAAIREAGADNLILVSGNAWSGAHSWISSGNGEAMGAIRDPSDNFAFDVHQYLDPRSTGADPHCARGAGQRLRAFTQWCRSHGKRAFLGEFGASQDQQCLHELAAILQDIADNRDVWLGWTYWAGGPWWPEDYPPGLKPLSLENPIDRPQMTLLRRYLL